MRCETFSKDPRTSLFSLHSSVLSNKFVANPFSGPWDPFFPWHVSLSSAPNRSSKASLPRLMDCGQEVETAAARCKAGMPCQRSERPKFLLKSASWSPNFLGLNKTSRHRYVNIPFTVLYWTASLKWAWCAFVSSVWPSKPCNLTWSCVKTPFHEWNMLKCCFGLSSF